MIKVEKEVQILTAESKPYNVNGNEGVSHRVRMNVDGEIYVAKSSADQVRSLQDYVGKRVVAVLCFESRKELLSMTVEFND